MLHGDLGSSLVTREAVAAELAVLSPVTIELAGAARLLALTVGLALGIAAALKRSMELQ